MSMLRVRKHKCDMGVLFSILILLVVGAIVIYAIGPMRAKILNSAYGMDYAPDYFFTTHLRNVIISLVVFFIAFKVIPYEKFCKYSKFLLILALGSCILLWLLSFTGSSLAVCELGACRRFNIAGISFQPAELLKLALVIYFADFIGRKKAEGKIGTKEFWMPIAVISIISLGLVVVAESDLGTGMAIVAIILAMLLISGIPMKQFLGVLGILVLGVLVVIMFTPYRMERVMTFVGGGDSETSYHIENAMMAIGSGGFLGVGIGNSVQATGYLPESINDSVFAIMGETFGFVGLISILAIFAFILLRMLKITDYTEDDGARLVPIGMVAWITMHVVANIMSMIGLIPVTGVTLPLLSYGGTSMIFIMIGLGFVMQLSCYTGREVKKNEDISSRRGLRRTHNSSRRSSERNS